MKRLAILTIILMCLAAVCPGQSKSEVMQRKIVQLSEPNLTGSISLEDALAKRRSVRQFTGQKLNFAQIGQLAWAGQGITEPTAGFRTAPSAGAIYPMSLYFATQDGLYIYHPDGHRLEEISAKDVRGKLRIAALDQEAVGQAACDIIIAGSVKKLAAKYGNNAKRFMLIEAGHIAQNIQLQTVSMELGCLPVGAFNISQVNKICNLPFELETVYIVCVGYPSGQPEVKSGKEEKGVMEMESEKVKKAVLIIASRNFRDEELFETEREITAAGIKRVIASTNKGTIKGVLGGKAEATILVNDIVVDDYDAIIFIGGAGAREYFNSSLAQNIARQAVDKKKVLGAICIAPTILANAGVLEGVNATSFASEKSRLENAGARYTGDDVTRDGLIITGIGPTAAKQFGETIVGALTEKK